MDELNEPARKYTKNELLVKLIYEVGRVADALEAGTDNPTGDQQ